MGFKPQALSCAFAFVTFLRLEFTPTNFGLRFSKQEATQKQRKSVAFSEGDVIMDTNGEVTDTPQEEKPAGTLYSSPEIRDSRTRTSVDPLT